MPTVRSAHHPDATAAVLVGIGGPIHVSTAESEGPEAAFDMWPKVMQIAGELAVTGGNERMR